MANLKRGKVFYEIEFLTGANSLTQLKQAETEFINSKRRQTNVSKQMNSEEVASKKAAFEAMRNAIKSEEAADRQRLIEFRNQVRSLEAEFRKINDNSPANSTAYAKRFRDIATAIEEQRKVIPETSRQYGLYSVAMSNALGKADLLEGKVNKLSFANQIATGFLHRFNLAAQATNAVSGATGQTLGIVAGGMGTLSLGLQAAALGLTVVAAAAGSLAQRGIPEIKEFQQAVATLSANDEPFLNLKTDIREFKEELGETGKFFDRGNIAIAIANIVKAGKSSGEAFDILKTGIKLAAAEGEDLNQVSARLLVNLNQYNLETSEAGRLGNEFAVAANLAVSGGKELSDGFRVVGSTAKAANIDTADLLGRLVELDNKGLNPAQEGATGLRTVLATLLDPSDKAKATLKELGVNLKDVDGNSRPLFDILEDLRESLTGNSEAANRAAEIFDTFGVNVILNLTDKSNQYAEAIRNSSGALDDYANKMTDGKLQSAQDKFGAAFRDFAATSAEPFSRGLDTAYTNLANFFINADALLDKQIREGFFMRLGVSLSQSPDGIARAIGNLLVGGKVPGAEGYNKTGGGWGTRTEGPNPMGPSTSEWNTDNVVLSQLPFLNNEKQITTLKQYREEISKLNDELANLPVGSAEAKAIEDKIEALSNIINPKSASTSSGGSSPSKVRTVIDEINELVSTYRTALANIGLSKELGIITEQQDVYKAKVNETNRFIDGMLERYQSLSIEELTMLDNAIARRDYLNEQLTAIESQAKAQKEIEESQKRQAELQRKNAKEAAEAQREYARYVLEARLGSESSQSAYTAQSLLRGRLSYLQGLNGMYQPENSPMLSQWAPNMGGYFNNAYGTGGVNPYFEEQRRQREIEANRTRFNAENNAGFGLTGSSAYELVYANEQYLKEIEESYKNQKAVSEALVKIYAKLEIANRGSLSSFFMGQSTENLKNFNLNNMYMPESSLQAPTRQEVESQVLRQQMATQERLRGFQSMYSPLGSTGQNLDVRNMQNVSEITRKLSQDIELANTKGAIFGKTFNVLDAEISATGQAINEMLNKGLRPGNKDLDLAVEKYQALIEKQRELQKVQLGLQVAQQGLNAAISAGDALAAGDAMGAINAGIGGAGSIAGSIANFIDPSGVTGQIIGQVTQIIQTVLSQFDTLFRSSREKLEADLKQRAANFKLLTEDELEKIITTRKQRREGLGGLFGLTDTVVDEEASKIALTMAEAFDSALAGVFSTAIEEYLTTGEINMENLEKSAKQALLQGIIQGFMEGEAVAKIFGPLIAEYIKNPNQENLNAIIAALPEFEKLVREVFGPLVPVFEGMTDSGEEKKTSKMLTSEATPTVQLAAFSGLIDLGDRLESSFDKFDASVTRMEDNQGELISFLREIIPKAVGTGNTPSLNRGFLRSWR
jgi:TP901 family phage tail tape measure protein